MIYTACVQHCVAIRGRGMYHAILFIISDIKSPKPVDVLLGNEGCYRGKGNVIPMLISGNLNLFRV